MQDAYTILFFSLVVIQIFRVAVLEKRYGKNKAYFITALLMLPEVVYTAFYAFRMGDIVYKIAGVLGVVIILGHVLYASYLMKFRDYES